MNDIELTQLFIDYAQTQNHLDCLHAQIELEILARAESVKIAGVEAKYYKPSNETPDYQGAVHAFIDLHPDQLPTLETFQTVSISCKWKEAAAAFGLQPDPGPEKPARVVIK